MMSLTFSHSANDITMQKQEVNAVYVDSDGRAGRKFAAFHLDRPFSLFAYLREIGKLFPPMTEFMCGKEQ